MFKLKYVKFIKILLYCCSTHVFKNSVKTYWIGNDRPIFPFFPIYVFLYMFSYICFPVYVFLYMFSYICFLIYVFLYMFSYICFPIYVAIYNIRADPPCRHFFLHEVAVQELPPQQPDFMNELI